jgi:hypothetical protein
LTPVADEKAGILDCCRTRYHRAKDKRARKLIISPISVDFKIENDYSIAVNELCKSISKINFDWVELWTSNLEKKPNAIIQSLCSRDRR